jgi:ABC-type multidrug transport system fused ATPase/permease subunit
MEQGNVGEYDTPDNLLEKENGIFKSLWMQYEESRKT